MPAALPHAGRNNTEHAFPVAPYCPRFFPAVGLREDAEASLWAGMPPAQRTETTASAVGIAETKDSGTITDAQAHHWLNYVLVHCIYFLVYVLSHRSGFGERRPRFRTAQHPAWLTALLAHPGLASALDPFSL